MNEKELIFFREATLRICGNLQIEQAMSETLKLLKNYFPVDVMYLQIYEPKLQAMRSIAEAGASYSRTTDMLIPMPMQALKSVGSWTPTEIPAVVIFNKRGDDPVTKVLFEAHGIESGQVMGLMLFFRNIYTIIPSTNVPASDIRKLMLEGDGMASIVVVSKGSKPYTPKDADFLALLQEPFTIAVSNALKHMILEENNRALKIRNLQLKEELAKQSRGQVIGEKGGLKEIMELLHRIAPSSSTVLLMGETGVGKEVLAHEIHRLSAVSDANFVAVNCGAIPESLIESELFGHEKGAFTGASKQHTGYFEQANGGTIFLDEIGELPESIQVKLLRVLQSKTFRRIGGTEEIKCDFRLIAATNRDLGYEVKEGNFREDLWYRINMFPLLIKPLRERIEDIPLLVDHFLKKKQVEMNLSSVPRLGSKAINQLLQYSWPGNVRELENVIERAIILSFGEELSFDNVGNLTDQTWTKGSSMKLDDVLRNHIKMVLQKANGKIHGPGGAAEIMGINANTLRNKMNKLGINFRK